MYAYGGDGGEGGNSAPPDQVPSPGGAGGKGQLNGNVQAPVTGGNGGTWDLNFNYSGNATISTDPSLYPILPYCGNGLASKTFSSTYGMGGKGGDPIYAQDSGIAGSPGGPFFIGIYLFRQSTTN